MSLDWFIIELTEFGETVSCPEIGKALKDIFGDDVEFFVPIHHEQMGSYVSVNVLMEGYVFVKDSEHVKKSLSFLKDSRIFAGLLKMGGKIQMLDSRVIGGLRKKLKNSLNKKYKPGLKVKVLEGTFENLEGEIQSLEDDGKIANIKIVCLSREIIAPIPTTCLEEIT